MRPILFYLGSFPIYSFGVLVALGTVVSLRLMEKRVRADGFPTPPQAQDLLLVVLFSGLLGARAHYIFQNLEWYQTRLLEIFSVWEGGLIFYGGMIASLGSGLVYLRWQKIPFLKGLDFLLPFVALTHAFGRVGCFLTGCCYGKACQLPWAVQFPDFPAAVHPTQLYEALFLFGLYVFLKGRYRKKAFEGEVAGLYFMIYAFGRFALEFFRSDHPAWFHLTWNQWWSLAVGIAATLFYFLRKTQTACRTKNS